jgi:4-amino-4-deoxy-L-arabinose transferase-like glycosyltransferase
VGTAGLAAIVLGTFAVHVLWLAHYRLGYLTEWDESGHIATSLRFTNALKADGIGAFVDKVIGLGQAPLVPLAAVPVDVIFGKGVFRNILVIPLFTCILLVATYWIAARRCGWRWGLVAALVIAGTPVVIDYSRTFHYSLPAAAMLTAAVGCVLRSDGLTRRPWVLAAGLFTALMLLTRTMTISYLPGIALGVAGLLIAADRDRRARLVNVALGVAVTAVVAGVWYVPNARSVASYLLFFGYGDASSVYGSNEPIYAWAFWSKELETLLQQIYLPLALVLLAGVVAWLVYRVRGGLPHGLDRSRLRAFAGTDTFVLAALAAEGYLALTSSKNEGTAFSLPWLPVIVILAITAMASIPARRLQVGLGAALVAVSLGNLLMKSGTVEALADPRHVDVPALGAVPVTDGSGLIHHEVIAGGYKLSSPAGKLDDLHRQWLPFAHELTGWMVRYADARGERPYVVFGSDHELHNDTRIGLAAALWYREPVLYDFLGLSGGDEVETYREKLAERENNFLVTTDPGSEPDSRMSRGKVETAARETGFRRVGSFAMPDGGTTWLWWRDGTSGNAL